MSNLKPLKIAYESPENLSGEDRLRHANIIGDITSIQALSELLLSHYERDSIREPHELLLYLSKIKLSCSHLEDKLNNGDSLLQNTEILEFKRFLESQETAVDKGRV